MSKGDLVERLVARSHNGGGSSVYNPFKADGIKGVTLAQELGLLGIATEGGVEGRPWAWVWNHGDVGKALRAVAHNADPRNTISGKVFWGATGVGLITGFFKRRGKTVRSGILKVN